MPRVFRTATSVLVWLGEGNPAAELSLVNLFGLAMCRQTDGTDRDDSKEAFANIFGQTVCRKTDGVDRDRSMDVFDYNDYDAEPDLENSERVNDIFLNFGKPGGYDKSCRNVSEMGGHMVSWVNSISALIDLSYWYRGWTFQEAYVNEHVSLCYAKTRCRVISWRHLWLVVFWRNGLLDWLGETKALPAMLNFTNWVFFAWFTWDAVRLSKWNIDAGLLQSHDGKFLFDSLTMNLWTIARSTRRTADPRDQVYSQIGAMTGLRLLNLKPDYASTTEQVFIATTLAILHTSRSWSHEQFFNPSESPFMPSWAIDFTLVPDHNAYVFQEAFEQGSFSADSSASFRLRGSRLGSLLTAGFIHDLVVAVEPCDRLLPMQTFGVWYAFLLLNYPLPRKYPTNKDFFEGFCRTLCMGTVSMAKFGPRHAAACRDHASGGDLGQRGDDWYSVFRHMLLMQQWVHETAMKFILTRNGHVGLAHRNVDVGDNIAIIATGDLPFIVRKVGKRENHRSAHILVGACYVDGEMSAPTPARVKHANVRLIGIMHGEAVRQRARRIYDSRERVGGVAFAFWKLKNRKSITWDEKLDDLSFSNDLACDLAFSDDICLV